MSDVQSSSSGEDDVEYFTCDEDEDDDVKERPGALGAASPSSSSSEDGRYWLDYHHTSEEEEEELDVLGAAPVATVRKETHQLHSRDVTGLDLQQMLQSSVDQLVPTSGSQNVGKTLSKATGSTGRCCSLNVQLNVTQQHIVEKATNVNQSFGGSQNISKTATISEGQKGKELSRADCIHYRTIKQFKLRNKNMVRTAALNQVLEKLNGGTPWLTIKGNPGEGKTTVGFMALEDQHNRHRKVFEVRSPDEFNKVIDAYSNSVIMIDDMLGKLDYDHTKWSNWESAISPVLEEREHTSHEEERITSPLLKDQEHNSNEEEEKISGDERNENKKQTIVIIIGRDYVLNSARVDLGRLSDFTLLDRYVVLIDRSMQRDIEEKRAIWESISRCHGVELEKEIVNKLLRLKLPHGFPHVCRLFTTIYEVNKSISPVDFFHKPLEFLNESISKLFKDKNKLSLFRQMVRYEGKISRRELTKLDPNYEIIQAARDLVGTYVRDEDGHFVFDHPSIYDSAAFHMSTLDPYFVIQQCHLSFLRERIRFKPTREIEPSETNQKSTSRLVALIDRSFADDLAKRFADEIMRRNFVLVLSHPAFKDEAFVGKVMCKIETPITAMLLLTDKDTHDTFLSLVPSSKYPELLKYIDNSPEVVLTADDENTLLYGTCKHAASSVLSYLKETRGSLNINVQFQRGGYTSVRNNKTPLMLSAETRDNEFTLQIISLHPDMTTRDDFGRTALHYFCEYGLTSAVMCMADSAADLDVKDKDGKSPLSYACQYNHLEIVKMLIERDVTVDAESLSAACNTGNHNIVELLLKEEHKLLTKEVLTMSLLKIVNWVTLTL